MKLDDWSDKLNPILLKEIRQFFHNRVFLVLMGLLMGLEVLMFFIVYCMYPEMSDWDKKDLGLTTFCFQLGFVAFTIYVLCGYQAVCRFAEERRNMELDYSRLSTLSPFMVTWGKLSSGIVVILFLHFICLPFFTISYFLRGISILQIWGLLVHYFPAYLALAQMALLAGSFGAKKGVESIIALPFVGMIIFSVYTGVCWNRYSSFWRLFPVDIAICLILGLFFVWTIAALTGEQANRAFWTRLFMLAVFSAAAFFGFLLFFPLRVSGDFYQCLAYFLMVLGTLNLGFLCYERQTPGKRLLQERPKKGIARFMFFLFVSGQAGGMAVSWMLCILMGLYTICIVCIWKNVEMCIPLFALLYFAFYAQAALFLQHRFPGVAKSIWNILVLLVFFIVPLLARGILEVRFHGDWDNGILFTTPFFLRELDNLGFAIPCLVFFGGSALALLPFVFRGLKEYVRSKEEESSHE